MVLIFSTNLSEIFFIPRRIQRHIITMFIGSALYSCQILAKLEFSRPIFDKSSKTIFSEIPSNGFGVVLRRQADGWKDVT